MSIMPVNAHTPDRRRGAFLPTSVIQSLHWWYQFSGPPEVAISASLDAREQVRRSRLASLMILGTLAGAAIGVLTIVIAAPGLFILSWTIPSIVLAMGSCLLAIPFNRAGHLKVTTILLLSAVYIAFAGIVLSESSGLDPLFLSVFDLLVTTELIAVSLLPPASVWTVAFINSTLIILDVNFQPHSMMWSQMIMSSSFAFSLLVRPLALYVIVALVAYLWVKSALDALRRADRAEVIAALEQREIEQKHQLEQGIQDILQVHVRVANGDLQARASTQRNNVLWQISTALNNLLLRYQDAVRSEKALYNLLAEVNQVRIALRSYQAGNGLHWQSSKLPLLTPLMGDLTRMLTTPLVSNQRSSFESVPVMEQPNSTITRPDTARPWDNTSSIGSFDNGLYPPGQRHFPPTVPKTPPLGSYRNAWHDLEERDTSVNGNSI